MKKRPNRYWAALLAPLALLALAGALMLHPSGAAMPASSPAAIPVSTDNWGLSFQTEGDCPEERKLYLENGDLFVGWLRDSDWGPVLTGLIGPYPDGEVNH